MLPNELSGPDLDGVVADAAILRFLDRIGATRLSDGAVLGAAEVAGSHHLRVKSRHGIVDIKRLAGRGQDRLDLENLERVHGELPIDPIPGLDS